MPETQITKEEPDLYRRSIKSGYWVLSQRFAVIGVTFAKTVIVGNFFPLDDLGIIAAAIMVMDLLSYFTQTGFEAALIQKKGDVRDYLDTAWAAGLLKGALLFGILYVCAPLLASLKIPEDKLPLAVAVFRVMGISFILTGFQNIGTVYFQKDLQFHKTFALSMIAIFGELFLTILLLYLFGNVWAVIAAKLITTAASVAGSYWLSSYRPRIHFAASKAREMWKFGKWISMGNVLGYLLETGDNFFVWFGIGMPQLALYRYAYNLSNLPVTHVANAISTIAFPAYSKIQDDLARLREAYIKIFKLTAYVTVPAAIQIFVLGEDFVKLFFKSHLHAMIPALLILAFNGMIRSIGSAVILKAIKMPHVVLYFQAALIGLIALTIYPFSRMWGIRGTAISVTLATVMMFPIGVAFISRVLKCRSRVFYTALVYPIAASVVMALSIKFLRLYVPINYASFFLMAAAGCAVYAAIMHTLDKMYNVGFGGLVRDQFKVFKLR